MTIQKSLISTAALALPLMGGLAAQAAVQIIDTIMLGRYAVDDLAGAVIATSVLFVFITVGAGIAAAALSIFSGQSADQNPRTLSASIWIAVSYSILTVVVFIWSKAILERLGQDQAIAQLAQDYLRIAGLSLLPVLLTMVLRSYATALERTQIVFWVSLAALPLNVFLNWVFIFGKLNAPEMGIQGAALATLLSHSFSFIVTAIYIRIIDNKAYQSLFTVQIARALQLIKLGTPIGLTGLAELGMFTAITLIIGTFGTVSVAAHGIVVQITSAAFIIHLALSQAATVKVGQAFAAMRPNAVRQSAKATMILSFGMVLATTILFVLAPAPLVQIFILPQEPDYADILAIATVVLIIAALSQLADAAQIVAMGALRGLKDTTVPMWIAIIWYWLVAVPLGYALGIPLGYGASGVWFGVSIGLLGAAATLWWRFSVLVNRKTN